MEKFGIGGFGEIKPIVQETFTSNPEKLIEQTHESLPAFLGYTETAELKDLHEQILALPKEASDETFLGVFNAYTAIADPMIEAIESDSERMLAKIAIALTEAIFYITNNRDYDRYVEALVQAEEYAENIGLTELTTFIQKI